MNLDVIRATSEFEKCIICRMILDREAVPIARAVLEDGYDFAGEHYGVAFNLLSGLFDKGVEWDFTQIIGAMIDSGVWDCIGEKAGFDAIITAYHTSADVELHCKAVRKAALKRRMSALLDAQSRDDIEAEGLLADVKQYRDEIAALDGGVEVVSGSALVHQIIGDAVSGRVKEIETPFRLLDRLARPLRTGTVTLLAGGIGASKTFMLLQILSRAVSDGIQSAALFLEEDDGHYMHRLWAQRAGVSELTSLDFIRNNSDYAAQLADEHSEYLDAMRPVIHTTPSRMLTHKQAVAWLELQAAAGCRLVCIDPVSALDEQGAKPWEIHKTFIDKIKKLAVDYQCAIVLTTHPTKATVFPSMESVAGGAAYTRFCQSVLWLENHVEHESRIMHACGSNEEKHDRTLFILKSRNSAGAFKKIALNMNTESLKLDEVGLIGKKQRS